MTQQILGLIPASGSATRFGGIPKFLLPYNENGDTLLEFQVRQMLKFANEVVVITRNCWVQAVLQLQLPITICESEPTTLSSVIKMAGKKYSADQYLVGFPDTMYLGDNPFALLSERSDFISELSLGCWPVSKNLIGQVGQVKIKRNLAVDIRDKDRNCDYEYLWGALRLSPVFVDFIDSSNLTLSTDIERYLLSANPLVHAHIVNGNYLDLGSFQRYRDFIISTAE